MAKEKSAEPEKNFTVRLPATLRAKAETAAKEARWPLGTWVIAAMEEKLARDSPSPPPRRPAR